MMMGVKLSEWARAIGVRRESATRCFHAGVLPLPARQLATATILVDEPRREANGVAICARVSSADQRGDLDCLVARVVIHLTAGDQAPTKVVSEVEVLTGFCAHLYGRRPAKRRAGLALAAATKVAA